jgi:UDP-glucose 4-epimerase
VIDAAGDVTGRRISVEFAPRRPGDPARLVASSERITRDFGWTPRHQSIEIIIASAWRWMQERGARVSRDVMP